MPIILTIVLLVITILLLAIILIGIFFTIDFFLDLPYVATRKEKIPTIIKLANIKSGDVAIDLGSGDGRLLFAAAKKGAHAIGYEINPFLVLLTRIKARLFHLRGAKAHLSTRHSGERSDSRIDSGQALRLLSGQLKGSELNRTARMTGRIIVKRQSLWKSQADLKVADVIFVYGRKKTMPRFEKFVYQNAKRGARIIVNTDKTVPFPNKKPLKSENSIYLYKV